MRLLHVTNILSHHQLPLARAFAEQLGAANFRFAATEPIPPERRAMGWSAASPEPWILQVAESDTHADSFREWWEEADVVLCGNRSLELFASRLARKKLVFYMSERWWKPPLGMARLLHPGFARMAWRFRKLAQAPEFHFLPIGKFAARDIRRIAAFDQRLWQWGYFPAPALQAQSAPAELRGPSILWVGRMLNCKRLDLLIRAFASVRSACPGSRLTLVGDGPERTALEALASRLLPLASFQFLDPMPTESIPPLMAQHRVFVLPSSGYEGWGAVINEAMAAGCVVISSDATGAGSAMIRPGSNGLMFRNGDWRDLTVQLRVALSDDHLGTALAQEGLETIRATWNPQEAARRFLTMAQALLDGAPPPTYLSGPLMRY